jgi:predicted permease
MRWFRRLPRLLSWRERREEELDRELRSHLELETEEREDAGISREEAQHAAQRAFGNTTLVKEGTRAMWGWTLLEQLGQDLRYAVRTLLRSPAFTVVAVLCIALGIGANTAIFTLVDAALLRMLPVADPERLVVVQSLSPRGGGMGFSYPQFVYLREHASAVEALAFARIDLNLSTGDLTDAPAGLLVSDNYFSTLGVNPAIGRGFDSGEDAVAVISYRFWQTRFHGDPTIVGRTVVLNGLPATIIGIAPQRFFGVEVGKSPDIFVPLTWCDRLVPNARRLEEPTSFWLGVLARLRPEISASQAAAEIDVMYHQGISQWVQGNPGKLTRFLQDRRIALIPGARGTGGIGNQFGTPLLILMAVVSFVLLIACANVANLLLARASARRRELAVRLALGAGRVRLLRQFLTESWVLSAFGGGLGLLFGVLSARALTGFLTGGVLDITLDLHVLGFTLLTSVLTSILFGTAPGFRATRADLTAAIKGETSSEFPNSRVHLGQLLVSGQVAMALLLLIGAGLFIRTLGNLKAMDMGFRGDHVLLATLNPGLSRYTGEHADAFYADLLQRVSTLPGVRSASLADEPLLGGSYLDGLSVEGTSELGATSLRIVAPRFFETMGITIRLGRDFSLGDRTGSPKVAIINETIARKYFAGENPIGKHVGTGRVPDMEIIGVIADTKYQKLRETIPNTAYVPMYQPQRWLGTGRTLHVRTFAGPAGMAAAVREQVHILDKNLPVQMRLLPELVDENLTQERLIATLSGVFGGLALLLTAMGLYGVIAYRVQRRTHEIGIRMSLGARRTEVLWMVLRDCLLLAAVGIAAGVPASLWLSRFVASQLFGVTATDGPTIVTATLLLLVVAAGAAYIPARNAARIDPMVALRYE